MTLKPWHKEGLKGAALGGAVVLCYLLPQGDLPLWGPLEEALQLTAWYGREHVLLFLVPAFFLAGGISVFVRQGPIIRLLGPGANPWTALAVASVSGAVLAVCSCTVLPLFAGIYRMGAGIGPACAFLYSGPAINVLAIILTARILGFDLGLARVFGAVVFSVVIGLMMRVLFRRVQAPGGAAAVLPADGTGGRALWQTVLALATLFGILLFANWARSGDVKAFFLCCPEGVHTLSYRGRIVQRTHESVVLQPAGSSSAMRFDAAQFRGAEPVLTEGVQDRLYAVRWVLVAALAAGLVLMLWRWFSPEERREWLASSWGYGKRILPLLFAGVAAAGFMFGRPGYGGLVPGRWVEMMVGRQPDLLLDGLGLDGTGLGSVLEVCWPAISNVAAALAGALMYFATLTEIPILQGLLGSGMGRGPALALLLAGPALSLPSMLVIRSVLGTRRTMAFVLLVVAMATLSGMVYGMMAGA